MKRLIPITFGVLCCSMSIWAQHISEQEAMERVLQYKNGRQSLAKASRRIEASPNGRGMRLTAMPVEPEKVYAFNMEGGGFVIASGDQRALPVLGYSTTGSIDWEKMPENMRSWLKQYDEAIATLGNRTDFRDGELTITSSYGQNNTTAQPSRRDERMAVEPLIKTHWDQTAPYWDQVPYYQGPEPSLNYRQCYVGCVATAMAQVMNYWQWPNTVPNGLPDYDYNIQYNNQEYTWHLDALPPTKFEWGLMINDYNVWNEDTWENDPLGTDEERKAVATLMRYCGQSIKMKYEPAQKGGSSAAFRDVPWALVNYFDYNAAQHIERRFFPSIDDWEEVIYSELAAGRPVVYGGQSTNGGHAFVCDGYDGGGLFHINWGWSGDSNGYFSLSVLNPRNNSGAGSGNSGIGYCISENATIYTDPKMEPQPSKNSESVGSIYQYVPCKYDDNEVAAFFSFFGPDKEQADLAFGTIDAEGQLQPLFMSDEEESTVLPFNKINSNILSVDIDSTMFTAGQTIDLYPMLRFRHPGEQWQVIPPMEQSVTVGRNAEGHFFIHPNLKTYNMHLTDIGITRGTGRLDKRSDITIRFHNNESSDYVSNLYLVPLYLGHITPEEYGIAPVLAKGMEMKCGAYIPANGEADVTFSFVPEYGGTIVFAAYTENGYIGELPLEFNNDILSDYDDYVENKSYLSRDGDKWYWVVELSDRIGVKMSHLVPSDNLCLIMRYDLDDEQVELIKENTVLKEYLAGLPDNIGTGHYTFTYKMPVEISQPGDYFFISYIAEYVNEKMTSFSCTKSYDFTVNDLTGVEEVQGLRFKVQGSDGWYDLQGRLLPGKPTKKGIYIHNGHKISIY